MDTTATMSNPWIPSKVFLHGESPVRHEVPFGCVNHENRYTEDSIREVAKVGDLKKFMNDDKINLSKDEARTLDNGNSSLISPIRINHRAQIDLVDIRAEESGLVRNVLIYEEQYTKYIVLKALNSSEPREVADKLVDIMTTIGGPRIIQSGNGREYAEQVVREIRLLLPDFCVVQGDATTNCASRRDFRVILNSWMKNNPGRSLSDALRIIQVAENTSVNWNGKIPSQLYFGRNICEDLRRTIGTKGSRGNVFSEKTKLEQKNLVDKPTDDKSAKNLDVDINIKSPKSNSIIFNVENHPTESKIAPKSILELETNVKEQTLDSEENFTCKICHKQYAKPAHLRNHMKTHEKMDSSECTKCLKTFHSKSLCVRHTKRCYSKDGNESAEDRKNGFQDQPQRDKDEENTNNKEKRARLMDDESKAILIRKSKEEKASPRTLGRKPLKNVKSRGNNNSSVVMTKTSGNSLLDCTYCKQKFNFPSVLKRHMRSHTNERPYACQLCNKSFKQLGHLSQHSVTHTDYRSFRCTICSTKFNCLEALKLHSHSHKEDNAIYHSRETYRLFECDNCKKVFTTKSVLERHIFTHTHERKYSCKICGKRFKQAGHVKSHMLVHTGERKFSCPICTKRFSLSNSLKKHMYVHNGEKPYQCDVCGSRFLEKRNLNGHLMTHTNERPYSCKICGKRYTLADTLRRHISAAHEDGRTYQCEICAKMFKQLAHLSVHKKVHNDERPFQCHLCEKNFKHKNVLKSHLAIHANVRPFECDVCKATFVRKTNLQTHIASAHMNERPYVCTICNKRFKQISHLNGHIVVHSNSMPYQCDFCDRRCNRLDNLKKHMRLHTKTKE